MTISRDTYSPSRYRKVVFHQDRQLLDSELNEAQEICLESARSLASAFFENGMVKSGLAISAGAEPGEIQIEAGEVWGYGLPIAINAQSKVFDVATVFEHELWLELRFRTITVADDPALQNPNTGEATAEREEWDAVLVSETEKDAPLPPGYRPRVHYRICVLTFDSETGMFFSSTPTHWNSRFHISQLAKNKSMDQPGPLCVLEDDEVATFPFWFDVTDCVTGANGIGQIPVNLTNLFQWYGARYSGCHGRSPQYLPLRATLSDGSVLYGVGSFLHGKQYVVSGCTSIEAVFNGTYEWAGQYNGFDYYRKDDYYLWVETVTPDYLWAWYVTDTLGSFSGMYMTKPTHEKPTTPVLGLWITNSGSGSPTVSESEVDHLRWYGPDLGALSRLHIGPPWGIVQMPLALHTQEVKKLIEGSPYDLHSLGDGDVAWNGPASASTNLALVAAALDYDMGDIVNETETETECKDGLWQMEFLQSEGALHRAETPLSPHSRTRAFCALKPATGSGNLLLHRTTDFTGHFQRTADAAWTFHCKDLAATLIGVQMDFLPGGVGI